MKKITIIILLAITYPKLSSAQLTKLWDYRFGGTAIDEFHDIIPTSDGGYMVAGYSESGLGGDKTSASQGSGDFWILKNSSAGLTQWDKSFGGSSYDELFEVQETVDGGYILGGWSNSGVSGNKSQASFGAGDYWIVKTDVNGNLEWDKTFGGSSEDYLQSIKQTADSGYILAGRSNSGISGSKTQANRGTVGVTWDYWVVKINKNGIKQWDQTYGGIDDDQLFTVTITSDGGYLFGGYSNSGISGEKSQASQGLDDYWIVKTDANGTKQWDKRFGGTSADQLQMAFETSDGGYILGGGSASGATGDKSQASRGNFDYWIVKTDASGVKQWDKRYGGTNADNLFDLIQTSDGGYLLGGSSSSAATGDKTQGNQGTVGTSYDYWILKIDALGAIQADKRFGGTADDYVKSVIQNNDGSYTLGGWSTSGLNGDKTQASRGSYDYWIVKVSGANSITTAAIGSPECEGSNVFINYTVTGTFNAGNVFTAQLSDSSGSFAAPTTIGTINATTSGVLAADIPFGIPASSNYKIQIVSSNPVAQDVFASPAFAIDTLLTFYPDNDNDSYGGSGTPTLSCVPIAGYVTNNFDCNDNDSLVFQLPFGADGLNSLSSNCEGSSGNLFDADRIFGSSSYVWFLPPGVTSSFVNNETPDTLINVSIAIGTANGTIKVIGKNSCGTGSDTAFYALTVAQLPDTAGIITGDTLISSCFYQNGISYSITPLNNTLNYSWTLPAGATIVGNADTNAIVVNYPSYGSSGAISVAGNNTICGLGASASLYINYKPIPKADICFITIDSTNQKSVLNWQRPLESYADSVVILRKNTLTNQFDRVVILDNVSPGYFLDTASKPALRLETYKIAVKDSCGFIGDTSAAITHKTIYLYGLLGWGNIPKLYWNDYVGITDTSRYYRVLRDATGSGPFQILKDSIRYNQNLSCVDTSQNAATCATCRYVVELRYNSDCDPTLRTMTGLSTTRSNIKNKIAMPFDSLVLGYQNPLISAGAFKLYPNPASSELTFETKLSFKECRLQLLDNLGKVILTHEYTNTTASKPYQINLSGVRSGFYTVAIKGDNQLFYQKVIVR